MEYWAPEERGVMKAFLQKLNNLSVFDPSLWPGREFLARFAGISVCALFIAHRILRFGSYTGELPQTLRQWPVMHLGAGEWHWIMWFSIWVIETGIFAGYILAFASRSEARSIAKGFMEVVFPFIVAAVPLLITVTPMNFRAVWPAFLRYLWQVLPEPVREGKWVETVLGNWEPAFVLFLAVIMVGGAINLVGLITLRKAFTIMSEARELIRHGIFSKVRHPLYAGHFVMFFGYLMFHLYWYTAVLYALFVVGQCIRVGIEERKLLSIFPEYAAYARSTGMFFPRIFPGTDRADHSLP
jgi:protein-S-isoprenylcysteine O-methyltransferase Ste14